MWLHQPLRYPTPLTTPSVCDMVHYNPIQQCPSQFIICYYIYVIRAEADVVIVLFGRGRARPAKVIYNSLGAPVPYSLRLWCVMYIDAIGAKINLTAFKRCARVYRGLPILTNRCGYTTNPYQRRRPYQRPQEMAM